MGRYFFHLHNDISTIDEEGVILPSDDAAKRKAILEARTLAAHSVKTYGHLILDHYISVTDDLGEVVCKVSFGEAIDVRENAQATARKC